MSIEQVFTWIVILLAFVIYCKALKKFFTFLNKKIESSIEKNNQLLINKDVDTILIKNRYMYDDLAKYIKSIKHS